MNTVIQISKVMKIDRGVAQQGLDDHYAVLGVPITASPLQVRDRYLSIAKKLHPDVAALSRDEREIGNRFFARMVNPAYFALNKARERAEYSQVLKLVAKRMVKRCQKVSLYSEIARALAKSPSQENYEKAVRIVGSVQYEKLGRILDHAGDLSELNLVYILSRDGYAHLIDRTPVADDETRAQSTQALPPKTNQWQTLSSSRAEKGKSIPKPGQAIVMTASAFQDYLKSAETYVNQKEWSLALNDLRSALKINDRDSRCHALMGLVYMNQKFSAMAKASFKEALKYNSQEPLALQYLPQLEGDKQAKNSSKAPQNKLPGWLRWLRGG